MNKRIAFVVLVLVVSAASLAWAFWPGDAVVSVPVISHNQTSVGRLLGEHPDLSGRVDRMRTTVQRLFAAPGFQTEQLCRAVHGLSDGDAADTLSGVASSYGASLTVERGQAADVLGQIVHEQCQRMYGEDLGD